MSAVVTRLQLFFSHQQVSIRQAEISIGASNGTLSRAIKRNTDIQSKWLIEIVKQYPALNVYWLLSGEGGMINLERKDHLEHFDKSKSPGKPGALIRELDELLKGLEDEQQRAKGESIRLRLYELVDHYFEVEQKVRVGLEKLKGM